MAESLNGLLSKFRTGVAGTVPLACPDKPVTAVGQLEASAVPTVARSPTLTVQGPCPVGLGAQTPMMALPGSLTLATTPLVPGLTGLNTVCDVSPLDGERECADGSDAVGKTNGAGETVGVAERRATEGTEGAEGSRRSVVLAEPNGTAAHGTFVARPMAAAALCDNTVVVPTLTPSADDKITGVHTPCDDCVA